MKTNILLIFIFALLPFSPFPAFSDEMIDYGAIWKAWGIGGQKAYLWGFLDGSTDYEFTL